MSNYNGESSSSRGVYQEVGGRLPPKANALDKSAKGKEICNIDDPAKTATQPDQTLGKGDWPTLGRQGKTEKQAQVNDGSDEEEFWEGHLEEGQGNRQEEERDTQSGQETQGKPNTRDVEMKTAEQHVQGAEEMANLEADDSEGRFMSFEEAKKTCCA
ncbi:hypothetical protein R1flu_002261 [Riccia fluitans]|uniref:Uncharacterized protein n=1 Tax=Riccia fluitans TaxID=41844 RepID=A0ABD1Y5K9_9MARC